MGRRPAIREAGPMIQWSIRTTKRARAAIMAAAKARGVSVGVYLDQISHPPVGHTHNIASLIGGGHDEPPDDEADPATSTEPAKARKKKRTPAEAEAERQRVRREVAQAVLDKHPDTPATCTHPLTEPLTSGLRRCKGCGETGAPQRFN